MVSGLPRLAIAVALACSIGLHWGLLQSAAWVGMVINYSQERGLGEALVKTFDGKHPCPLCKAIAKAKNSEKKGEFPPTANKFDFLFSRPVYVFSAPTAFWAVGTLEERADSVSRAPPLPPPKAISG